MRSFRTFLLRLTAPLTQRRRDQEFRDEIESHLQLHIDDNLRAGMTPDQARRNALVTLGGVAQTYERMRDRSRLPFLDALGQDLGYTLRTLRGNRGFTATATLTLALGIGATTAIFSVVNAVLLRPLPFPNSHELLACAQRHEQTGLPEFAALPDYLDWREHNTRLRDVGGAWPITLNLTGIDEPERLAGAAVTNTLFPTLAVAPLVGRWTSTSDDEPQTVVLGHQVWMRHFGGDAGAVGRTVELNGRRHTIVGVMPAGFTFPPGAQLWIPLVAEPGMNRGYHFLNVVARLKPGATLAEARAELEGIAKGAARTYPATNTGWGVQVTSLLDGHVHGARRALVVLASAVVCVLLIACANVAALLIARSTGRRHEIALRSALGASPARIARQLVTESIVLAALGGIAGLAVARFGIEPLVSLTTLPRAQEITIDATVLLFTMAVSLATGIGFGLVPLLALPRGTAVGWRSRASAPGGRLRAILVAIEVCLAVVLLAGAGVLLRSFHRLHQVDVGFNADRVLTVRFFLPRASYPAARAAAHYQQMIDRLATLPDVESAAAVSHFPFSDLNANVVFEIPGRPPAAPGQDPSAEFRSATPGYFRVIGIPLLRGRDFAASDGMDAPLVAIVNEAMAQRFFPEGNALGGSVRILGPKARRIVGIVPNIRHRGLDAPPEPEIFVPHAQYPLGGMSLAIRTRIADPARLAATVRAEIRSLDRNLPIAGMQTFRDLVDQSVSRRRFSLVMLTTFAIAALTLSVVGIYGVLALTISQRTKEIGIRVALGAGRSDVLAWALRRGMLPVLAGLAAGLAAAFGTSRTLADMLFETNANDPMTLGGVAAVLLLASLAATLVPARRAVGIDPMITLRQDDEARWT